MSDDIHIKDLSRKSPYNYKYYTLCGDLVHDSYTASLYQTDTATCLGCIMVNLANLVELYPEALHSPPDE